jgi:hypothetical protein
VARQVSGAQSDPAHEQESVAQAAGRVWHPAVVGQPPRQPGWPVAGQLAVALVPAGHAPPSGGGVQVIVAQLWWLTHSWPVAQAAASPHALGAASDPASPPAPASDGLADEPQPAVSATSNVNSARRSVRFVVIVENANTSLETRDFCVFAFHLRGAGLRYALPHEPPAARARAGRREPGARDSRMYRGRRDVLAGDGGDGGRRAGR